MPCSIALRAAVSAAMPAAYGVLFREPLNPLDPELLQDSTAPVMSVSVTIVLLNVDWMYARPRGICRRSRRRTRVAFFFVPGGMPYLLASTSSRRPCVVLPRSYAALFECAHWSSSAGHAPANSGDGASRDSYRSRS